MLLSYVLDKYDDSTASCNFNIYWCPIIDFNNTSSCYNPSFYSQSCLEKLARAFAKLLSDAEKAALRVLNIKPTADGIRACLRFHSVLVKLLNKVTDNKPAIILRIPCWSSLRWKSLT